MTSDRIVRIAWKILGARMAATDHLRILTDDGETYISNRDIRALAASALGDIITRAVRQSDKRKPKKNGRVKVSRWKYRRRGVVKRGRTE